MMLTQVQNTSRASAKTWLRPVVVVNLLQLITTLLSSQSCVFLMTRVQSVDLSDVEVTKTSSLSNVESQSSSDADCL